MAHAAAGLSGIRKRDFSICPIEEPLEFDALVAESRKVSGAAHTVDLLCFDAGLRLGEATALRWEDRSFGRDATGTTRSLRISASRSSDLYLGNTRSERERSVAMPRRLRGALLAYQLATTHAGLEGAPTGSPLAVREDEVPPTCSPASPKSLRKFPTPRQKPEKASPPPEPFDSEGLSDSGGGIREQPSAAKATATRSVAGNPRPPGYERGRGVRGFLMFLGCCGVTLRKRLSWIGLVCANPPQQSPHTDRC
jgi:hypothetical protein